MLDFSVSIFIHLLLTLKNHGYNFIPYANLFNDRYLQNNLSKIIILRHDVEDKYPNALRLAQIENNLGLKGSYYFRLSNHENLGEYIKRIASLGHEIGYHYDDLSVCKGNTNEAVSRFLKNLTYLRSFGTVETITMEGAPLSKFDNRDLWKIPLTPGLIDIIIKDPSLPSFVRTSFYENVKMTNLKTLHYSLFNIKAEPYLDLDFNEFFYITDTGRCWNGYYYSVRDKIPQFKGWIKNGFSYRTTQDIIKAVENNQFPSKTMITIHPQRWHDKPLPWVKEWIGQNIKNIFKYFLIKHRES